MSTLLDYADYELEETEIIQRKLDPPVCNIPRGIPWIAQKWPEIQLYLLTGNIYLMGEAPLEAPSSRQVSLKTESVQKEESDGEKYDILGGGQEEEEEEDIFNLEETSHAISKTSIAVKGKNSEDKSKSRSSSIIYTVTGGRQCKGISLIDTVTRQK